MKIVQVRSRSNASSLTTRLLDFVIVGLSAWFAAASAEATQSVTLAWDPSPDTSVIGYNLHYGTASRVYDWTVDAGAATTVTVTGLLEGQTYFFAVTAYNQQRIESEPSVEVSYTVPVGSPNPGPDPVSNGGLRIVRDNGPDAVPRLQLQVLPSHQYLVQASEDLRSWKTIHVDVSSSTNWVTWVDPEAAFLPKRFYRLMLPDKPVAPGILSILPKAVPQGMICLRPSVMPGQRYEIQVSQDLVTWTTIHEGICVSTKPMDFVDSEAGLYRQRFYRLALPDHPPIPSSLRIFRGEVSGGARLRVAALEGLHYRIQASQDLTTWTTIYEGIGHSGGPVDLVDPEAGRYPQRFYRLVFE